jgi:choice-of-anchor A domain-containing protein
MFQQESLMSDRFTHRGRWSARSWLVAVFGLAASLSLTEGARAGSISWQQFDVVALNNFSSPSDVEGWTLVGGNITGNWNGSIHQNTPAGTPTVIVGGTLGGNLNLQYGSVLIASNSNITGHVNYNGGNGAGPINSFNGMTASNYVSTVKGQLEAASAGYTALTANNTVTFQGGNTAVFNATAANANGVAVFTVAASSISSGAGIGQYELGTVASNVTSIVINVTGSGTFSESANFIGGWSGLESTTMWNFAPTITAINTGAAFDGALMALGATLTTSNDQNGAVFVNNLSANSEVHLPLYDGFVPASGVPEPSTLVMLSVPTILGLGYWARRRVGKSRTVLA